MNTRVIVARTARGGLLTFALVFAVFACGATSDVREFDIAQTDTAGDWSKFFDEHKIEFSLPGGYAPLRRIGRVIKSPNGSLLVADGQHGRILAFGSDGQLVRGVPDGRGSPIRIGVLGAIATDTAGDVFVFDVAVDSVTELDPAMRQVLGKFKPQADVADILSLDDKGFVTYSPASADGAFSKLDKSGRLVTAVHPVRDERLRIFHARVQNGGITRDPDGDLFGIEPTTFELVQLSPSLRVELVLRGASPDAWAPPVPPFPRRLSPYRYESAHVAWWDSFLHIGRPLSIARGVLLVTLFSSKGLSSGTEYANIYTTGGRAEAEGLRVPHNGRVVGAGDSTVFVAVNARLSDRDSVLPMEFYEYRLRNIPSARRDSGRR